MDTKEFFYNRLQDYEEREKSKKRAFDKIANFRLAIILIGAFVVISLYIRTNFKNAFLAFVFFLLLVILLIIKHYKTKKELIRTRAMVEINKRYLDRLNGDWINFKDCGMDFVEPSHPYTSDLDIFGPKSLFQWASIANTFYGRQNLQRVFTKPQKEIKAIKQRQEAVKELADKLEFCQNLQCEGLISNEVANNPEDLIRYAEDNRGLFTNKWIKRLFYLSPLILLTSFVLYFTGSPIPILFPITLMVLHLMIIFVGYRRTSPILNTVHDYVRSLEAFGKLLLLIEEEDVESEYLLQLKEGIKINNTNASEVIKLLEKISSYIDIKYSPLVHFVQNIIFLWDYYWIFELEGWKKTYGMGIRRIFDTIGEFEAIASLAVIHQINDEWIFPKFNEGGLSFHAAAMGHPLLNKDHCVCNSIDIRNNSSIITGSNMSGKTTFLRTIGINLVLAYGGGPVYAKELKTSLMDIFTSMRVSDDLNSGVSTFYGELLRIKMIIDYSSKRIPMIYLIDEMFRGTNSKDRVIGARSVLKNLNKSWIIGLISTHDFELCDLELDQNLNIQNYHFTENYSNNEIYFDYKLRRGRSSTTNAKYLMKMVGIHIE
ncbi:MutS family DNA mismatch repair protein [Alkaliphilus serpentinus]|uniref:DNA mismatch repair protein MutS n=1 Tax=Alkaliphilus serpentinus TaxID=1482731 RepID=A0A833M9U8_9FIRM|nr:MutS family DNA mismatch repair protein [Alkaliphilus serpentinus]KAB3529319.1 DNA mismatch repair protein MutS [Alkaliphilus serpentinus]